MKFVPLEEMIAELKESGLRNVGPCASGPTRSAETFNRANRLIGCHDDIVTDMYSHDADGSDLFITLLYQNLLLAQRIEALEDKLAEG